MTKIKNTKKGMAKKTLSMSLVVAMLATSNVPVWAAEFGDGTEAAFTSEAEAPAVDTVDEFSDDAADAVVVDDTTSDVPAAQVAEGYTVNTNMELKDGDWATGLKFEAKSGVKDTDAKFEILDKNTVVKPVTKVEVYSGNDALTHEDKDTAGKTIEKAYWDVTDGKVAKTLSKINVGLDAYKNSKQVTVKFYVDGENTAVYEATATVKAVDISEGWEVTPKTASNEYNGKVQSPVVKVSKAGYEDASVIVKFDDEKDAKNVDTYNFSVEGVEADGYIGTISEYKEGTTAKKFAYDITPVAPTTNNISVTVSGSTTYNGGKAIPTVVVTDKLTNTVIPSYLYTVDATDSDVKEYDKTNLKITLNKTSGDYKVDGKVVKNNFEGQVPEACISGSYKVEALDLSKLSEKYNVAIANKKVGEAVNFEDITLTDKTTGEVVKLDTVLGAFKASTATASAATKNDLVTIVTSDNTAAGTGKIIIRSTDASSTKVVNEFTANFNVVNATISAKDVSFPKGTKITTEPLDSKKSLEDVDGQIKTALSDISYTGSAIEPLKEAFSNLVLTNSATVTDQKLVLGTDYDLVYTNNTDANDNSKVKDEAKKTSVKLVFKGNYSGTLTYFFNIKEAKVIVKGKDVEYVAGKSSYDAEAKVVTVDKDGKEVAAVPEKEYTVTTTTKGTLGNKEAKGVVVFNNKNYIITGTDAKTNSDGYYYQEITSNIVAKDLKNCTATVEGNYVFTGESVSPKLVVKDGNTVLVEGTDYIVTSKTGTNAGPAHVTITGKKDSWYTGSLTVDYTIAKANLANATVESKNDKDKKNFDLSYTGYPVDFANDALSVVKIGNAKLEKYDPTTKKGDYTVTWDADAAEVGTYNFTITATAGSTKVEGEYKGTFKIVPKEIKAGFAPKLSAKYGNILKGTALTVDKTGAYYSGKAITIDSFKTKYVVVDDGNNVLTEGKDYELRYKNNIDAGVATVEAYGIGNRKNINPTTGKEEAIATLQYNIEPTAVITSDMVQKISDVEYAGGLPVEPQVVIIDAKGNRLVQGTDYTVETKITDVTAKDKNKTGNELGTDVVIKGKGAYLTARKTGSVVTTDYDNNALDGLSDAKYYWKVTKKDLANTTISIDKANNVTVMNGVVAVSASEYNVKFSEDGKKVTVTAKSDSKNYTGSKEIEVESAKVGQAIISDVIVNGNTVTPVLSSEADDAVGYDYVLATENNVTDGRIDISKNILSTHTNFYYVPEGTYYVYCHAWKRGEDGKKVFGEWSNIKEVKVEATTPSTPTITSVKVKGSTVTVTYTESENATGYDVVLGTSVKKVNGERRPVEYGKLVKKNVEEGTVEVTFTNVPSGTYYAGLHAYNRTSVNASKVFSKWSNHKTVRVK